MQIIWWIFPGTSIDLNLGGRSGALWGMRRSPNARTSTIAPPSLLFFLILYFLAFALANFSRNLYQICPILITTHHLKFAKEQQFNQLFTKTINSHQNEKSKLCFFILEWFLKQKELIKIRKSYMGGTWGLCWEIIKVGSKGVHMTWTFNKILLIKMLQP